jgi:hypothetical protein
MVDRYCVQARKVGGVLLILLGLGGNSQNSVLINTTNSKSIVFFSAQNEIFVYVGIIDAENLFDI